MTVKIARHVYTLIQEKALEAAGREVCGLLIGTEADRIERCLPVSNVSAMPESRFEIAPEELFAAQRAVRRSGEYIVGHYHSHPDGRAVPSACDADNAHENGVLWMIVGGDGRAGFFRSVEKGPVAGRFVEVKAELI